MVTLAQEDTQQAERGRVLLAFTATTEKLLSGTQAEKDQRILVLYDLYQEANRRASSAESENHQFREQHDECITELEEALTQEQQRSTALAERVGDLAQDLYIAKTVATAKATEENTRWCDGCRLHAEKDNRQRKINDLIHAVRKLDHTQMDSSDKLLAIDYIEQAADKFWDVADFGLPFHPVMEQTARRLGLSESQLTRINQTQPKAESWNYTVNRKPLGKVGRKQQWECTVTVELGKILTDPSSIQKPPGPKGSHQGGERARRCKDCGSDDLDRTAVEYCRRCKTADL